MKNSLGLRVKELRTFYNLSVKVFAATCGLSHVAIFNLEKDQSLVPHRSSVNKIVSAFGTTQLWLLEGKGEMLPEELKDLYASKKTSDNNFWKKEAYLEIKNKNSILEKELERLWQLLDLFTTNEKLKFEEIRDMG